MSAWSHAADTELVACPVSLWRVTTARSSSYAVLRSVSGSEAVPRHGAQCLLDRLGGGPAAGDDGLGHRLAQPDGFGRFAGHGQLVDGERVGVDRRKAGDDAGPDRVQCLRGRGEHVADW
jgi:hypothetical protein